MLSHNDLVAFDATIPVTLTEIYLDHNSLTAPPNFSITSNIEILHIQYNTFQISVDYFESFTNLRELSIEKMGLTFLPNVRKNTRSVIIVCIIVTAIISWPRPHTYHCHKLELMIAIHAHSAY